MDPLDDFAIFPFSDGKRMHDVYRKGSGPAVIVIHEMPNITPECARFARRVVDAGFTVFMPSLFGTPGEEAKSIDFSLGFVKLCVGSEFSLLAKNHASPVTDWLRALARTAFAEIGGRGVGAIGMCITGNFALTMALDRHLMAPVLCQPALPLPILGFKDELHASPEALATIQRRHGDDGLTVIGLRFEGDTKCPKARFDRLEEKLGEAFERHDLPDSAARTGDKHPHSVLTRELIDEAGQPTRAALDRVLAFFAERLR
jgi:dienelactone hydrolase